LVFRTICPNTGGFVIATDVLSPLAPIENAAMRECSVTQWDKDNLEALGLLKINVLALGILIAIRNALR
jgi:error-prone DNA polymerase